MITTTLEDLLCEINPRTILFVVSCTTEKIWDDENNVPAYVEAKRAYTGKDFRMFLEWMHENGIEEKGFNWIILSGKYGFIEPLHPIGKYDILLGDPRFHGISDESLQNQVKQGRWWKNKEGMEEEITLEKYDMIICVNCKEEYQTRLKSCFQSKKVFFFDFAS